MVVIEGRGDSRGVMPIIPHAGVISVISQSTFLSCLSVLDLI